MNLNEFYIISYKDYKNQIENSDLSLFKRINQNNNHISIRIYDNEKFLLYRFSIYNNKIMFVKKGDGEYVKFNLTNIKKKLLQDALKLLDSNDSLNHALFLEILKLKLNE